jgi:hypothetical protein
MWEHQIIYQPQSVVACLVVVQPFGYSLPASKLSISLVPSQFSPCSCDHILSIRLPVILSAAGSSEAAIQTKMDAQQYLQF